MGRAFVLFLGEPCNHPQDPEKVTGLGEMRVQAQRLVPLPSAGSSHPSLHKENQERESTAPFTSWEDVTVAVNKVFYPDCELTG